MIPMIVQEMRELHREKAITNRFELWAWFIKRTSSSDIAEIGVWKGDFASHLLKNADTIRNYYMIDPWANLPDWNKPFNKTKNFELVYTEAIEKTSFATEKIKILRGRTLEVVDQIKDESLDFAYIDGDHTLRGITIDLISILPKIKQGGFIGCDDFRKSPWQHFPDFEPTLVCPLAIYFAEAHRLPTAALGRNQFLIHKDSSHGFSFDDTFKIYGDITLNRLPEGYGKLSE